MTIDDHQRAADAPNSSPGNASIWLDLLGSETRFRNIDGYTTRSLEAGQGEAVVLLHGLSGHAETWERNVLPLAQGFRVHALDMLGHGLTAKPKVDYSVQLLGEHVLAFMDAIGVQRAHLVGQSLGGWVAGWLAVHRPDRVASLVSVTGAGLELTEDGAELTAKTSRNVGSATQRAIDEPTLANVRTRLEWLMYDTSVITTELVETRFRIYNQPDFLAVAGQMVKAFAGTRQENELLTADRLATISCPTLVLWTRYNPTMPHRVGEAASEIIPDARYYLMEDAGHWPQFERPAEFNEVVGTFLHSVVGRSDLVDGVK